MGQNAYFGRGGSENVFGMAIVLASGFTYAFHIVYIERSGLNNMYCFKFTYYSCWVIGIGAGLFGVFTGNLQFALTPNAWLLSFLLSMLCSVGAISLLKLGVAWAGAATAAILSTFEPITNVILGILLLNEQLTLMKALGCVCILTGVMLCSRRGHTTARDNR